MKTIVVVECKRCGQQYIGEGLMPMAQGTEISLIIKGIGQCSVCKEANDRSSGARRRKKLQR